MGISLVQAKNRLSVLRKQFNCTIGQHRWGRWRNQKWRETILGMTTTQTRVCQECRYRISREHSIINET